MASKKAARKPRTQKVKQSPSEARPSSGNRETQTTLPQKTEDSNALAEYHHLPDWYKDNEYIVTGYRTHATMAECFYSVFSVHNETGNIWSHLGGFFLFLYIFLDDMVFTEQDMMIPVREITDTRWARFGDWAVFSVYLFSVKACLLFSSLFHIVLCHSHDAFRIYSKLDYAGIALLSSGSFYPLVYYWFYCRPHLQFMYLVLITAFGLATANLALTDSFATPPYRTTRAIVFTLTGFTGAIPGIHFVLSPDDSIDGIVAQPFPFLYIVLGVVCYLLGALLYSQRIPERLFVGHFDYWFHSHQVFHLLVVLGALFHYWGCHEALAWNSTRMCSVAAHDIY